MGNCDRDDLLRTIHRMIDNGHAARWQGFITAGFVIRHVNGVTIC